MDVDATPAEAIAVHFARQPRITVLGVQYMHLRLDDGSDLYVTEYGRPFIRHLLPVNHCGDQEWFAKNSRRLIGTSAIYRITTKTVGGHAKDIVLKWNRMGQDIPGETGASDLVGAEFNSPFEEFSLVKELRQAQRGSLAQIGTQEPLAIYVPRRYVEAERIGRRRHRLQAVQQRHEEITLDPNRHYAVIYKWLEGIDAAQACGQGDISERTMQDLTVRSRQELKRLGFRVRDSKPHHVIIRPAQDGQAADDAPGSVSYGLVDFELLERTSVHEQEVRASKRRSYLVRQAHRFEARVEFPPELTPMTIMDVEYVYGQVESTAGALWVVGKDPVLFEYFLPEKWRRTPRTRLAVSSEGYYTVTKDNIHLVWHLSRVGRRPEVTPSSGRASEIVAHGYNSPFEAISFCLELTRNGIATTYPRAIYMTGHKIGEYAPPQDDSRYESHQAWETPDGHPILGRQHDYMIIWGYWNGPDEWLAVKDQQVYEGISATDAREQGLIAQDVYQRVHDATAARLAQVGIEDLDPRGDHLLLSLDRSGRLVTDRDGLPTVRISDFSLLRRRAPDAALRQSGG